MQIVREAAVQRPESLATDSPPSASMARIAKEDAHSSAHALRQLLPQQWGEEAHDDVARVPPDSALLVMVGVTVLLWGLIIGIIVVLL